MGKSRVRKELRHRLRARLAGDDATITKEASQKICRYVRERLTALFVRAGRISRLQRPSSRTVHSGDLRCAWEYERVLCAAEDGATVAMSGVETADTEPADRQLRDQYRKANIVKTAERRHRHTLFSSHCERLSFYAEEAQRAKARLTGKK